MKRLVLLLACATLALSAPAFAADDTVKSACPNGVKANRALAKTAVLKTTTEKHSNGTIGKETEYSIDIVNKSGECFKVGFAQFIYRIDDNHAIYKVHIDSDEPYVQPQLFVFDYGTSKIKHRKVSGIIKATGKYASYKDREGFPRKMPQFLVIKENNN